MEKLSVTIITLNEGKNIRDALESVKWADEIVVVDSGSTDETVEICREYTDKVFHNPWPGHIAQKNFAIDKASYRWIFSIDADERVTPALAEEIKETLKAPDADGYAVPRHVFYLGQWINHSGWYPDYKVRLFRRDRGRWGGINPHDRVIIDGVVRRLRSDLLHYSFQDIAHHIRTMNSFTSIAAMEYYKRGRNTGFMDILLRPAFAFIKSFVLKQGFRDGLPGFVISVTAAYHVFIKYVKLWEMNHTHPPLDDTADQSGSREK